MEVMRSTYENPQCGAVYHLLKDVLLIKKCGFLIYILKLNTMNTDNRTERQIKAYFLFLTWIADEMKTQNIPVSFLIEKIKPDPTKEMLHQVFKKILETMYWKMSTKEMTRKELNWALDVFMDALANTWVHLDFPDSSKENLLQFYK